VAMVFRGRINQVRHELWDRFCVDRLQAIGFLNQLETRFSLLLMLLTVRVSFLAFSLFRL
jgi:hypothetical protein